MLWGRMPKAMSSLAEEILSHISIKIKKERGIKWDRATAHSSHDITNLPGVQGKNTFACCCKFHFWFYFYWETTLPRSLKPQMCKHWSLRVQPCVRLGLMIISQGWLLKLILPHDSWDDFTRGACFQASKGYVFSVRLALFRMKLPSVSVSGYCCCSNKASSCVLMYKKKHFPSNKPHPLCSKSGFLKHGDMQ